MSMYFGTGGWKLADQADGLFHGIEELVPESRTGSFITTCTLPRYPRPRVA